MYRKPRHSHRWTVRLYFNIYDGVCLTFDVAVGIYAEPSATNHRHFFYKIAGPQGTAYEGGMFHGELYLPDDYPMMPPKVLIKTKIFHPNIDKLGMTFPIRTNFCRSYLP